MEQLIIEFIILLPISVGIGIISSMTGISGGAFKAPLLIILFSLTADQASAASLLAALFGAVVSTIGYHRQNPSPINLRVGLLIAVVAFPGTYLGVVVRTIAADLNLLRVIFGILLFPIALKLLLVYRYRQEYFNIEESNPSFSHLGQRKLILSVTAFFLAGVSAGFLGLGGGIIIVPVLCIMLGFPTVVAAATSMFAMIFTSASGSLMNYLVFAQSEGLIIFIYYGLMLSIGMIIGCSIGPRFASKVSGVLLQKFFGFILIFPLVKMMALGQLVFDPSGSSYIISTAGDVIIWLLVGTPLWLVTSHRHRNENTPIVE